MLVMLSQNFHPRRLLNLSFLYRFPRKARPARATTTVEESHSDDPHSSADRSDTTRTAKNALKLALKTLSTVSSNVPFGSALNGVIGPLLDITDRVEQISTNEKGLTELATRIKLLAPVVSEMAKDNPERSRTVIEALKQELQSITQDLNKARSKGKLAQFFNSIDNASVLSQHNAALARLIDDSTLVTVNEILKSLHDLEPPSSAPKIHDIDVITGGLGGPGSSARIGGEGGVGEGPEIELGTDQSAWTIGNISGGTGGPGGAGTDVGGKGGTGKGPVIRFGSRL